MILGFSHSYFALSTCLPEKLVFYCSNSDSNNRIFKKLKPMTMNSRIFFKYLTSGIWVLFLMSYWDVTTSFLYDTLPAFSQATGSKLLGSLLFSIFLIQFFFPLLGLRFFKYLLHLTFSKSATDQSPASNLETLIRGVSTELLACYCFYVLLP